MPSLGSGEVTACLDAPISPSPLVEDTTLALGAIELQELVSSVVKPPMVDLKPLPSNLKYVFLADGDKLPVIISSALSDVEEGRLVSLLKSYRGAIGWSLSLLIYQGLIPRCALIRSSWRKVLSLYGNLRGD